MDLLTRKSKIIWICHGRQLYFVFIFHPSKLREIHLLKNKFKIFRSYKVLAFEIWLFENQPSDGPPSGPYVKELIF